MKISKSIIAMACAALACIACSKGATEVANPYDGSPRMGIQLYSLRSEIGDPEKYAANKDSVFAALQQYGYTAVEPAHYKEGLFYGVTPEQFAADLDAYGLKAISSHTGRWLSDDELANHDFTEALAWWDEAIPAHKAAGMEYIVAPSAQIPATMEEAQTLCDYFNEVGARCREAGIAFGYHNHSREFTPIGDSDILWYDYMAQNTDPENVFLQLDTYWCMMAQQSPVEYFKKYPGRYKLLHIKDKYEVGGSGMMGFDAIFRNADTAGMQDYIVEIEGTTDGMTIYDATRASAEYLKNLLK